MLQLFRYVTLIVFCLISIFPGQVMGQSIELPVVGAMVNFSPRFDQVMLKGVVFHPNDPFAFDFVLDAGQVQLNEGDLKAQSKDIAAYFLTSLTTPQEDIWVNLSPYEAQRVVPQVFGNTFMGQNLLAQDYLLKQIMATALYPERELGKAFWKQVYAQVKAKYGDVNVPINAFNKVWIVPNKAVVYKNAVAHAVFVAQSSLKVMLERDYLAAQRHQGSASAGENNNVLSGLSSNIVKQIVLPALEKEVNEGKNFAPLRQIYHALILAAWYKKNLKDSIIARAYVDRNKIGGLKADDDTVVERIYQQYINAYKQGVFNFIKDDYDTVTDRSTPRKYFSGGFVGKIEVSESTAVMAAAKYVRPVIAAVAFVVAGFSSPQGMAQSTSQADVRQALGASGFVQAPVSTEEQDRLLGIIKLASEAKGDMEEAARAFDQIAYHPQAMELAAKILRLPENTVDQPMRNMLNSSDGLGTRYNFSSGKSDGVSVPIGVTNQGLFDALKGLWNAVAARQNVGNPTLRLKAAFYLERYAKSAESSGVMARIFDRGVWESLTQPDPNATVQAARLIAMAAFIGAGNASRQVIGVNITGLGNVYTLALSSDPLVQAAALGVFASIPIGDADNKFQDYVNGLVIKVNGIVPLEIAARIAQKHNLITSLPALAARITANQNSGDIVQFNAVDLRMQQLIQHLFALSPDARTLIANLQIAGKWFTLENATEYSNTTYIGTLYMALQAGRLTKSELATAVNAMRIPTGLTAITADQITFEPRTVSIPQALAELAQGKNVDANARAVVYQGGPFYAMALWNILKATSDEKIMQAIVTNSKSLLQMGVYPKDRNPFDEALKKSINNPTLSAQARLWLNSFIRQNPEMFPSGNLALAFADLNRGVTMALLQDIVKNKQQLPNLVAEIIAFTLKQSNPTENSVNVPGATEALAEVMRLSAQALVYSGLNDVKINKAITDNADSTPSSARNAAELRKAIEAIRSGSTTVAITETVPGQQAEELAIWYLKGSPDGKQISPQDVVKAMRDANKTYKSKTDPNSGYSVLDRMFHNALSMTIEQRMRMIDVLRLAGDLGGSSYLPQMLNSGSASLDLRVLQAIQASGGSAFSAHVIVDVFIAWAGKRSIENPESVDNYNRFFAVTASFGKVLNVAIKDRLIGASPTLGMKLRELETGGVNTKGVQDYTKALLVLASAKSTVSQVLEALKVISGLPQPPAVAFGDMGELLKQQRFTADPKVRQDLIEAAAQVRKKLGETVVAASQYQEAVTSLTAEFSRTKDARTLVALFKASIDMHEDNAGSLVVEGVKKLRESFPDIAKDKQQHGTYFGVLMTVRDLIRQSPQRGAITASLKADIRQRFNTDRRFEHPEVFFMVLSLDPSSAREFDYGFNKITDDRFEKVSSIGDFSVTRKGMRQINAARTRLAGELESLKTVALEVDDPLMLYANVMISSNHSQQRGAMVTMGKYLPLVAKEVTISANSKVFFLRQLSLIDQVEGTIDPRINGLEGLSPTEEIVYAAILGKSKSIAARVQLGKFLQEKGLIDRNPAGMQEALRSIGRIGEAEDVPLLLDIIVNEGLYSPFDPLSSIFKDNVSDTIKAIALRQQVRTFEVVRLYAKAYDENHPRELKMPYFFKSLRESFATVAKKNTGDKAMAVDGDHLGGIDLARVNVADNGGAFMNTFNDQLRYTVLLNATGLKPVIKRVVDVAMPVITQLLGAQ